ncbi:GNAT family N-acetyltransferase [uncultured Planktosalinus sp.]|uniref:GNAT family N-acetyltransferase n=1 Tax=uncultured Planktosalinus sp. TaxID=1810935 RepID=UPI0030DA8F0E
MTIFAETDRLVLRELLLTDVDGIYALDSDPDVHTYLGNKPLKNKAQALEVIKYIRQQYEDHGIGRWAMIEKETNTFLGWTGIKLEKTPTNNYTNYYDLGYRIIKKYWGKGYATESAVASLAYGFQQLKLKDIYGAAHIDNTASNKVLTKVGMQASGEFLFDNEPHHWYHLNRDQWKRQQDLI